ncbi:MAG: hypothetical protein NTY01_03125 [Verrucomicrobia bacterium]|nr:hypothetical protein [Verrucomicrobiota bacterium]
MKHLFQVALLVLAMVNALPAAEATARSVPKPLAEHPGNVFLAGEEVFLRVPDSTSVAWRLLDYDDKLLMTPRASGGSVSLGRLPVGFYRLRAEGEAKWISCAVLEPLAAPTPLTSPVALDVAMAWFYPKAKMDGVANLCVLAGVNQVRDRLSWSQMEPKKGEWAGENRYDESAQAQARAGLQVLQVNHSSPSWANPNHKRFPLDLRDVYRFYREMARRWQGQVQAFEPWNEADISGFGGHTGSEMATLQKASYLGLKAGNPNGIACLNVFATHNRPQLDDLQENEACPYFDTYNLHHYEPFEHYPRLYADHRAVSAGKPLWVSECALPVKWAGDERLKEPTDADLRIQSERVAKTFACSLHEGSVATFYFMLPHYVEGQTQFGLLRPDLTPRPGYVALAAVGRWLADAKPLGRLSDVGGTVRGCLFRAKPGGQSREVLVAWTTSGQTELTLPVVPGAVIDHLGRSRAATSRLPLSSAPLFAALPEGSAKQLLLQSPPVARAALAGKPSPVVIQALWPEEKVFLRKSAYRLAPDKDAVVPLFVYNFSEAPISGALRVSAPEGWKANSFGNLEIAPQSRAELRLELTCRAARVLPPNATVRVTGDFGPAGQPVLSMRVMTDPELLTRQTGVLVPGATHAARWIAGISGGVVKLSERNGAVAIEAEPTGADKWVYPRLVLPAGQHVPDGAVGLCCTLTLIEGSGTFRTIFDESNGSGYVVDFLAQPKPSQTLEALALFEGAVHGDGWSKPDPNHRLDADQIAAFKIGCNPKSAKVVFTLKNVRWVTN